MTLCLNKANTTEVTQVSSATALLCEVDQAGMWCRSEQSQEQGVNTSTGSCAWSGYHRESAAVPHLQNALPDLESELWIPQQSLGKD